MNFREAHIHSTTYTKVMTQRRRENQSEEKTAIVMPSSAEEQRGSGTSVEDLARSKRTANRSSMVTQGKAEYTGTDVERRTGTGKRGSSSQFSFDCIYFSQARTHSEQTLKAVTRLACRKLPILIEMELLL